VHDIGAADEPSQPKEATRISVMTPELNDRDSGVRNLLREGISGPKNRQRRIPEAPMSAAQHPRELTLGSMTRHPADHVHDA
jgi:hypothetical protein